MIHEYWALLYKTVWLTLCLGFVNSWQSHMVAFQNMWRTIIDRMIFTAQHKRQWLPAWLLYLLLFLWLGDKHSVSAILSHIICNWRFINFLNNINHARLILLQFMQLYGTWHLDAPWRHWFHYRFSVIYIYIYIQHFFFVCSLFWVQDYT